MIFGSLKIHALNASGEQFFYLKQGDKIKGKLIEETDAVLKVKTAMGVLLINKGDLQQDDVAIFLKDGSRIQGILVKQTVSQVYINTALGLLTLATDKIDRLVFFKPETRLPKKALHDDKWYFSDEQLIDIWFDPTGFNLQKSEIYLSALSWGVGVTDQFQITSRWSNYFSGDFNIRPKWILFSSGNIQKRDSLAVGFHLHTADSPDKYRWQWVTDEISQPIDPQSDEKPLTAISRYQQYEKIGDDHKDRFWGEFFLSYSFSQLRRSGQGRINYTAGMHLTYYPNEKLMPRVYAAVDIDILRNLKIMAEVFYDPYYLPLNHDREEPDLFPLFFDIGFITNRIFNNEKLWVGIHFQKPMVSFYYKW